MKKSAGVAAIMFAAAMLYAPVTFADPDGGGCGGPNCYQSAPVKRHALKHARLRWHKTRHVVLTPYDGNGGCTSPGC